MMWKNIAFIEPAVFTETLFWRLYTIYAFYVIGDGEAAQAARPSAATTFIVLDEQARSYSSGPLTNMD